MKVGFTGARNGTTCEQHKAMCEWVKLHFVDEWHHGCCIGADSDGADVCKAHASKARIVAHPPTNRSLICSVWEDMSDEIRNPMHYLDRNRAIVDACDVLIACPKGPEELRSGTWSTIRYARKKGKPVVIFWPDGKVSE